MPAVSFTFSRLFCNKLGLIILISLFFSRNRFLWVWNLCLILIVYVLLVECFVLCSNWAMMNQDTRRLSKMPDAVRAEISPWFLERSVMEEDDSTKRIPILDDTAPCRTSGLLVRNNPPWLHTLYLLAWSEWGKKVEYFNTLFSFYKLLDRILWTWLKSIFLMFVICFKFLQSKIHDLDMNQHVNHVKYIDWLLEVRFFSSYGIYYLLVCVPCVFVNVYIFTRTNTWTCVHIHIHVNEHQHTLTCLNISVTSY